MVRNFGHVVAGAAALVAAVTGTTADKRTVQGTATPNSIVSVYRNNTLLAQMNASAQGTWSYTAADPFSNNDRFDATATQRDLTNQYVVPAIDRVLPLNGNFGGFGHHQIANSSPVTGTPSAPTPLGIANQGITSARSMLGILAASTGQAHQFITQGNYGQVNDTTAPSTGNTGMTARIDAAIVAWLARGISWVYLDMVGNNIGATRTSAGADGTTAFSVANTMADVNTIIGKIRAAGIVVVLANASPRGETAFASAAQTGTNLALLKQYRAALATLHDPFNGVYVYDPAVALANDPDLTNGNLQFKDGHSFDGISYSGMGAVVNGIAFAAWANTVNFSPIYNVVTRVGAATVEGTLSGNPDVVDADNSGTWDGWAPQTDPSGITTTRRIETLNGERWQVVVFNAASTPSADWVWTMPRTLAPPDAIPGGRISGSMQFRIPAGGVAAVSYRLTMQYLGSTTGATVQNYVPQVGASAGASDNIPASGWSPTLLTETELAFPIDATSISLFQERVFVYGKAGRPVSGVEVWFRGSDVRYARPVTIVQQRRAALGGTWAWTRKLRKAPPTTVGAIEIGVATTAGRPGTGIEPNPIRSNYDERVIDPNQDVIVRGTLMPDGNRTRVWSINGGRNVCVLGGNITPAPGANVGKFFPRNWTGRLHIEGMKGNFSQAAEDDAIFVQGYSGGLPCTPSMVEQFCWFEGIHGTYASHGPAIAIQSIAVDASQNMTVSCTGHGLTQGQNFHMHDTGIVALNRIWKVTSVIDANTFVSNTNYNSTAKPTANATANVGNIYAIGPTAGATHGDALQCQDDGGPIYETWIDMCFWSSNYDCLVGGYRPAGAGLPASGFLKTYISRTTMQRETTNKPYNDATQRIIFGDGDQNVGSPASANMGRLGVYELFETYAPIYTGADVPYNGGFDMIAIPFKNYTYDNIPMNVSFNTGAARPNITWASQHPLLKIDGPLYVSPTPWEFAKQGSGGTDVPGATYVNTKGYADLKTAVAPPDVTLSNLTATAGQAANSVIGWVDAPGDYLLANPGYEIDPSLGNTFGDKFKLIGRALCVGPTALTSGNYDIPITLTLARDHFGRAQAAGLTATRTFRVVVS